MTEPIAVPVGRELQELRDWKESALQEFGKSYVLHQVLRDHGEYLGWDVHAAAADLIRKLESALSAALAPPDVLDLEPIKRRLARDYGGGELWTDSHELRDVRALLAEVEHLRAALAPPVSPTEEIAQRLCLANIREWVDEGFAIQRHKGYLYTAGLASVIAAQVWLHVLDALSEGEPRACLCGHSRAAHTYYQAGGIFTACQSCTCEAYEPSRVSPVGPTGKDYPHRCSGCGLRWQTTAPGSVAAELCGDCWRKVQPILHASPPAGVQEQGWQPIATAPKEARVLALLKPQPFEAVGEITFAYCTQGVWTRDDIGEPAVPTHWMPLPDPPSAASVPQEPPCEGKGL
jgi:hypothetical protein